MVIPESGIRAVPRGQSQQLWQILARAIDRLTADGIGLSSGRVTVLDCGGGSGRLAVPLAGFGADVTVVDVSADALSTLLRRADEAGVATQIHAVQGDAETLCDAVPSGRFGLVLAHDVLSSVSDREGALGQLVSCVEPGGLVSLVNANPASMVLARALAGDAAGALAVLNSSAGHGVQSSDLILGCEARGLVVDSVTGLGVFTELLSGRQLDSLDAEAEFTQLEAATSMASPYRDIAARIHLLARKPASRSA